MKKTPDTYGTVKLSSIEKAIASIKNISGDEDVDVTFEFLIGSFFPEILTNIKKKMAETFIEGYAAGKEGKNDN